MRLYNNAPATPLALTEEEEWVANLRQNQFVLRDFHSFASPRVGGWENSGDWASSYKTALSKHEGQSWRIVNEFDPVPDVPPVVVLISWWNHVDNGYNIFTWRPPSVLASEIHTQPSVQIRPWNFGFHRMCLRCQI